MKSIPIISLLVVAVLLCMAVVARDVETTTDQAPAKSMETTMSKRTISGTGHDITPLTEEQIAELAANGGAPMGFYTRFTDPEARREIVRYYQFQGRHDSLFRGNRTYAEDCS